MKPIVYLLRVSSLIFVLLCCYNCSDKKNDVKTDDKSQVTENEKEEIAAFFKDYLSGKQKVYSGNASFALQDIVGKRELVWEAWKEANNNFDEQKLIELTKLDYKKSGRWDLPDSLEPHAVMPYYYGSKRGTGFGKAFPLYVYLHGSGDKGAEWMSGLGLGLKLEDAPSVYFIPQIPNTGEYYRWWQKAKQFAWEKMLRLAFVSGQINPNKVYFFGISEGGYGSQRLASFYADYLAGAGPMAGGEPLKNAPAENCRNLAFSMQTGENDMAYCRNKLTQQVKEEFERLKGLFPDAFIHRVELVPGQGHGFDFTTTTPWLKQYTRNPYPRFVNWENFEMDGRYRNGFYNLFVKERSNKDNSTRTYYELAIQGNEISLKVDLVTYTTIETDPMGIDLKFEKKYQPATKGKVVVYLCEELVNMNEDITLMVNGKKAFQGKLQPELGHLVNSCAAFFDPQRLYPAAIEVNIAELK